jgi:hypothetical protein
MVFIKAHRKQLLLRSPSRMVFAAALSAGLGLAVTACGGEGSVTPTHASSAPPSTTAPAARTPDPPATTSPVVAATTPAVAASPAGTWNVTYADDPTSILGQYTIIEEAGAYVITTETVLKIPDAGCSLPAGEEIGTFSASGAAGTYSGTERLYDQGTCAFAGTNATLDVTVSGSTMLLLVPGQQSVALTRTGTAAAASPAASLPPATAASAGCTVPDEIGAGLNGHIAAAAAEQDVAHACPPAGYHVVTVLTVSGPAGTAQGELWKESPSAGSSAPPGSTVTLYFQP